MQCMTIWDSNAACYCLSLPVPSLPASREPEPLQYCHPYSVLPSSPATRFSSSSHTNSPTARVLWSEGKHTGVWDWIGPSEQRGRWQSVYRSWGGVLMLRYAETAWTERRSKPHRGTEWWNPQKWVSGGGDSVWHFRHSFGLIGLSFNWKMADSPQYLRLR